MFCGGASWSQQTYLLTLLLACLLTYLLKVSSRKLEVTHASEDRPRLQIDNSLTLTYLLTYSAYYFFFFKLPECQLLAGSRGERANSNEFMSPSEANSPRGETVVARPRSPSPQQGTLGYRGGKPKRQSLSLLPGSRTPPFASQTFLPFFFLLRRPSQSLPCV